MMAWIIFVLLFLTCYEACVIGKNCYISFHLSQKSLLKTYPEDYSEDVMQTIGTKIQSPPFENETLA